MLENEGDREAQQRIEQARREGARRTLQILGV
jgi:hypothetical protein